MAFTAIVFKPGQKGEVVNIETKDFSSIVEGLYERTHNVHAKIGSGMIGTEVIVNEEGVVIGFPRNRGYHGTFIIVKPHEDYEMSGYQSFTEEEVKRIKKELDNKKTFESENKFLATFFEEKDVPVEVFSYNKDNHYIQISNYDVIDALLASEDMEFLQKVEMIIRKIDFSNGDVNHFLQHMGEGLADQIAESNKNMFS